MIKIEISDAAYDRIRSTRRGKESVSTILLREIKCDSKKRGSKAGNNTREEKRENLVCVREELDILRKTDPYCTRDDAYKVLGLKK